MLRLFHRDGAEMPELAIKVMFFDYPRGGVHIYWELKDIAQRIAYCFRPLGLFRQHERTKAGFLYSLS